MLVVEAMILIEMDYFLSESVRMEKQSFEFFMCLSEFFPFCHVLILNQVCFLDYFSNITPIESFPQ